MGVAVVAESNVAMVAVMTMTPIHMEAAGESLAAVGLAISGHVAGNVLARVGAARRPLWPQPMIARGGLALIAAGVLAAVPPGDSTPLMGLALARLGVGWNLGLVGGSALLTDAITSERRAQAQGGGDLVMNLTRMSGNLVAGPLFHAEPDSSDDRPQMPRPARRGQRRDPVCAVR